MFEFASERRSALSARGRGTMMTVMGGGLTPALEQLMMSNGRNTALYAATSSRCRESAILTPK
jgi:hypothetical protein